MDFYVPSTGSLANLANNALDFAGQAILSNSSIDALALFVAGVLGGQNWLCGTVYHVGTSPGNGINQALMSACALGGNAGSTPPSQLCLACHFPNE